MTSLQSAILAIGLEILSEIGLERLSLRTVGVIVMIDTGQRDHSTHRPDAVPPC